MKRILIMLLSVFGITALAGCAADDKETATVESVAFICGIGSTANVERFAGVIESGSETKVEKDSEKKIAEVLVKVGDTVQKDQVLFRYDKAQTELNIQKTEIEIEQLNSSAAAKRSEIETLEKEISSGSLDAETKTSYQLQIQELNADVTETNLSVKAKTAELDSLKNTLNNLEVKSPDEGTIQAVNNDGDSQDTAFITIKKTSSFRVKGYVNETNRGSLYEGMEVLIRSRVDEALQKGSIKTIDLKNPVSGQSSDMMSGTEGDDTSSSSKYPFYIELEKTDGFIIGQHVYIEPDYGQAEASAEAMLLPSYYINDAESSPWVWARDKNERLEKRNIVVGDYDVDSDTYEVKEGLTAEDFIATPGDSLKTGMKCVEFDFSTDTPQDITFDDPGMTEDGGSADDMVAPDGGSADDMVAPDGGSADDMVAPDSGSDGSYSPGAMSPFLPAPGMESGGEEVTDIEEPEGAEAAPGEETEGEVQAN